MLPIVGTILLQFQFALRILSVFLGCVVPAIAFSTLQGNELYALPLRFCHDATLLSTTRTFNIEFLPRRVNGAKHIPCQEAEPWDQ